MRITIIAANFDPVEETVEEVAEEKADEAEAAPAVEEAPEDFFDGML